MRNKLIVFVLIIMLIGGQETYASENDTLLSAYNEYIRLKGSIENYDIEIMKSSYDIFDTLIDNFTYDESEEWKALIEKKEGLDNYYDNMFKVVYILDAFYECDNFIKDKNIKNAMKFVESYEDAIYIEAPIDKMGEDIVVAYNEAKKHVPDEDTLLIYEIYMNIKEALDNKDIYYMEDVIESFNKYVDTFNDLTKEQLDKLAKLLELESGEEAYKRILSDWNDINKYINNSSNSDSNCNDRVVHMDDTPKTGDENNMDILSMMMIFLLLMIRNHKKYIKLFL